MRTRRFLSNSVVFIIVKKKWRESVFCFSTFHLSLRTWQEREEKHPWAALSLLSDEKESEVDEKEGVPPRSFVNGVNLLIR